MYEKYILICEIGWHRTRDFSLGLAAKKIPHTVLIKGVPEINVRNMITRHKGISHIFIPAKFFIIFIFIFIFFNVLTNRRLVLLVEGKNKTYLNLLNLKKIFHSIELSRL